MRTLHVAACGLLIGAVVGGCATMRKDGTEARKGRLGARQAVTFESLLGEMTNLAGMAEFPDPPYTCRQFSSYDRKSVAPGDESWFANNDRGQYLRVEQNGDRKEYVMMEAAGPGAVVRIWSANPKGTLRVYLDEHDRPAIEAPLADLLGGKVAGIPSPIAGERSRGWNSYLPIPYAKHCKITCDEGDFYYHVNYRTYAAGTPVRTFKASDLEKHAMAVERVGHELARPRLAAASSSPFRTANRWDLAPGEFEAQEFTDGPRSFVKLIVRVSAADVDLALRQVLLSISFDGEQSVGAPLGDFFGTAPGMNHYESLPAGVGDGELWCRWVMPYQNSARVVLHNGGEQPVNIRWWVHSAPYAWTANSMHFHAGWRAEFDVPSRPMRDWNYLDATGRGVFAGASFSIANLSKTWWGEGDEKIYVDGEPFPSHFGTGTEDYFGYAWCCNVPFAHAYHNQPRCDGPGNYGYTSVNRWHIIDRIPFTERFRFDMEIWHWVEELLISPSVVAYWYARPGGSSGYSDIAPEMLRLVEVPEYVPMRVAGALEGEQMRLIEYTGTAGPQDIDGCSNDQHLWWRHGQKVGDRLVLGFNVPSAGRYDLCARCVKAKDYGQVQLHVNGAALGSVIDLFNDRVIVSEELELGPVDLIEGENRLEVEIVGGNEQAIQELMFGLDYLRARAVE